MNEGINRIHYKLYALVYFILLSLSYALFCVFSFLFHHLRKRYTSFIHISAATLSFNVRARLKHSTVLYSTVLFFEFLFQEEVNTSLFSNSVLYTLYRRATTVVDSLQVRRGSKE